MPTGTPKKKATVKRKTMQQTATSKAGTQHGARKPRASAAATRGMKGKTATTRRQAA